jgi:glycerol-3-phosphate dehydrogenase
MTELETDVLVIGGGSTGAGVAWDSALRGFHVTLVDRGDLATGTTGRFHGLLHSGGRYVVKDPSAARECAVENLILRRVASDCIEDTGGLFVTTPLDDPAYADKFVAGCREAEVPVEEVPVAEALRKEPRLNPMISRAFAVPDASIDAWKTVWACVRGATAHGATVMPYQSVVRLLVEQGAVRGAVLRDASSGEESTVIAGCTVNASGAWSGQLAQLAGCEVGVVPGKGIMVAMNHRLVNTTVNRCQGQRPRPDRPHRRGGGPDDGSRGGFGPRLQPGPGASGLGRGATAPAQERSRRRRLRHQGRDPLPLRHRPR